MSLPVYFLRPVAVGVLLAVAGCGVSSNPESAAVPAPAQPAQLIQQEALMADSTMAKRALYKMPNAGSAPMPQSESYPQGYRDEQREQYQALADNPVHSVAESPVSTFSADVDTGAYANVRRLLNQGRLPQEGAVRLEEMVTSPMITYCPVMARRLACPLNWPRHRGTRTRACCASASRLPIARWRNCLRPIWCFWSMCPARWIAVKVCRW